MSSASLSLTVCKIQFCPVKLWLHFAVQIHKCEIYVQPYFRFPQIVVKVFYWKMYELMMYLNNVDWMSINAIRPHVRSNIKKKAVYIWCGWHLKWLTFEVVVIWSGQHLKRRLPLYGFLRCVGGYQHSCRGNGTWTLEDRSEILSEGFISARVSCRIAALSAFLQPEMCLWFGSLSRKLTDPNMDPQFTCLLKWK